MNRAGILLFVFFAFTISILNGQPEVDKSTLLPVNKSVPSFKFEISKGKVVSFNDYRGKMVLINFFATWCAPCRRELPLIEKQIWLRHKDNPSFVMLTFGRDHSWDEVIQFGKDQKFSFPILPDPKQKVYGLFATGYIPRSFLVDESGKIIFTSAGFEEAHFNELKNLIDNKLK